MHERVLVGAIEDEFEGADLGDQRLADRLAMLASALGREPGASIARISKSRAAREGAYRFVENPRVTMDALLRPHQEATAARCCAEPLVYVVSDTTEVVLAGEERGKRLGRIQGKRRGFLVHAALAVSASDHRAPLGVLGLETIVRAESQKKHRNTRQIEQDPDRESARWGAMVTRTEELLDGMPAIHVMDREADMFELLGQLVAQGRRFVIRAGRDRALSDGKLFEAVAQTTAVLERSVRLSPRRQAPKRPMKGRGHPARQKRIAKLTISAARVTLRRPRRCPEMLPANLDINVVRVFEPAPPDENVPIEWLLATSEPVETPEQIAAIVDAYRARWTIEEYFKALKTGCAFETRQLRSIHTLTNALGLLAPIAWRLLLLRALEREAPTTPAADVLDPRLLDALAAKLREIKEPRLLPANPTVADFMQGIARLGGHHASNGPPGWQLLWYGFQHLLTYGAGFIAGISGSSCDHS